jgi:hypothetical protein
MAKRKQKNKGDTKPAPSTQHSQSAPASTQHRSTDLRPKPLKVAKGLSGVLLLVGLVMLVLGGGVLTGKITEGWGFPMSAVSNWGKPWGAILIVGALAYIVAPLLLFVRPQKGTLLIMAVCGLSVLVGTPLITTTTEIFYNLLAQHDCQADWTLCHPNWIDSVWGYFMIVNIGILVATYKALDPAPVSQGDSAPQRS